MNINAMRHDRLRHPARCITAQDTIRSAAFMERRVDIFSSTIAAIRAATPRLRTAGRQRKTRRGGRVLRNSCRRNRLRGLFLLGLLVVCLGAAARALVEVDLDEA